MHHPCGFAEGWKNKSEHKVGTVPVGSAEGKINNKFGVYAKEKTPLREC